MVSSEFNLNNDGSAKSFSEQKKKRINALDKILSFKYFLAAENFCFWENMNLKKSFW